MPIVAAGPASDSAALRGLIAAGAPVFVRAVAGPPPPSLAPLVTIHDAQQREILLVGIDGTDLVLRRLLRAFAWGLETPSLRARGVLQGLEPGDLFTLAIMTEAAGRSVEVASDPPLRLAWTLGRSWSLLLPEPTSSAWGTRALDLVWIALLVMPTTIWARRRLLAWMGVGVVLLAIAALPWLDSIDPTPVREWAGVFVGMATGLWCSRLARDHPMRALERQP
jgi:hypothetical protein